MTNVHGKKSFIFLFILLFALTAGAADYGMRFPQQKSYKGLNMPADQKLLTKSVVKQYKNYKEKYLKESENTPGGYYILSTATDGSKQIITVSEAHGWGMTIFAYMAGADTTSTGEDIAKKYFDGMVKFWNDHKDGDNLMHWRVFSGEWSQSADGAATDGDLDIANAFVLAYKQWGDSQYLEYAKSIINSIRYEEMNSSSYLPMIGNFGVAPGASRPSDWVGNNFKNFKAVTNDGFWDNASDAIYSAYNSFVETNSSSTGLITDFVDNGQICGEWFLNEFKYTNSFNTNACRVPFRFAYDYFLWESNEAKLALYKIGTWANKKTEGSAANLKSGYWVQNGELVQEGTELGVDDFDFNSMYFMASFMAGVAAVPTLKDFSKDLYTECGKDYSLENADAFGDAIYLLSLILISGNAWDYYDTCTYVEPEPIDSGGVIFDDFNNIFYDDNEQTALGAAFGASKHGQTQTHFGGCYWYTYKDAFGSTIKNGEGTVIDSSNFKAAVVNDTTNKRNYLHLKLKNAKEDQKEDIYPFTGFGAYFRQDVHTDDTTKFDTKYVSIDSTKHVVIKAKGTGLVKVMMITKAFDELPEDDQWGHFAVDLELEEEMTEHAFTIGEFLSNSYNEAAKAIKWEDARKAVKAIHFEYGESDKELEIEIDEIRFTNLEYERDFGFEWVDPVEESIINTGALKTGAFNLALNSLKNELLVTLPVQNTQVEAKLYNVQGRVIKALPLSVENSCSTLNISGLSSGVYFLNVVVDGIEMTKRFTL